MSLLQLIDDLPTDILLECAKYIYLPPNKLLQEINHYGKNIAKGMSHLWGNLYLIGIL